MSSADDGTTAIATEAGGIIIAAVAPATTSIRRVIPWYSFRAIVSGDGLILEAAGFPGPDPVLDQYLRQYDLRDASLTREFRYAGGGSVQTFLDFDLARSASAIARSFIYPTLSTVTNLAGTSTTVMISTGHERPVLSTMGTRVAFGGGPVGGPVSTTIYNGARLTGSITGSAVLWMDDTRLVVSTTNSSGTFTGVVVVDESGAILSRLPSGGRLVRVNATRVLDVSTGNTLDAATGSVMRTSIVDRRVAATSSGAVNVWQSASDLVLEAP